VEQAMPRQQQRRRPIAYVCLLVVPLFQDANEFDVLKDVMSQVFCQHVVLFVLPVFGIQ
jgi:hypothetical protein